MTEWDLIYRHGMSVRRKILKRARCGVGLGHFAGVAQLIEQGFCKAHVGGLSPSTGSLLFSLYYFTSRRHLMDEVTITREEYDSLRQASETLQALEDAGVDNWEGYELAMEAIG